MEIDWFKAFPMFLEQLLMRKLTYRNLTNFFLQILVFWQIFFSCFWPYLWQFLSYRDVPYLILILSTIPFDLMKGHFAVEQIVFELYGQTSVLFFFNHTLIRRIKEKVPNLNMEPIIKMFENLKEKIRKADEFGLRSLN